jgi:nucleolar protein 6
MVLVPNPAVRLISLKGSTKSKGCAFVEFSHSSALQQGLKLHHTILEGRKINVELTAGGGGRGKERLKKLRERNRTLNVQRVSGVIPYSFRLIISFLLEQAE